MAEQKTKPTEQSIGDFLATIDNPSVQADCVTLVEIMREITQTEPVMWGKIVGFGKYHYKYASGHEGDSVLTGFAPRKQNLTLYLMPGLEQHQDLLAKLGKHSTGKGCLYIKRLADVDIAILKELIQNSVNHLKELYPS